MATTTYAKCLAGGSGCSPWHALPLPAICTEAMAGLALTRRPPRTRTPPVMRTWNPSSCPPRHCRLPSSSSSSPARRISLGSSPAPGRTIAKSSRNLGPSALVVEMLITCCRSSLPDAGSSAALRPPPPPPPAVYRAEDLGRT